MDAHFWKNARKIHLISYNFMGKHAFWTASFQCLAKSLALSIECPAYSSNLYHPLTDPLATMTT